MLKFALLTHRLPGYPSGQSLILARLLEGLDSACYCIISHQRRAGANTRNIRYISSFSGLSTPRSSSAPGSNTARPELAKRAQGLFWLYRRLNQFVNDLSLVFAPLILWTRARQIGRIVREECCTALVACSGDLYNLPAAYLACRQLDVALVVYLFDDYVFQASGLRRLAARLIEPLVLRAASVVIVTNEVAADEYRRRYPIEPVIVHNSYQDELNEQPAWRPPLDSNRLNLVYTGSVYSAHYDAFRNLVRALEALPDCPWQLHIFTDQPPLRLGAEGIGGAAVRFHQYVSPMQIPALLRAADLVFLPLSFSKRQSVIVRTASPGKMSDYLAAGTAILVHAPAESFVSQYCRRYHCAAVADENSVESLVRVLQSLTDRPDWREALGQRAAARAKADFHPTKAREAFSRSIQQAGERQ